MTTVTSVHTQRKIESEAEAINFEASGLTDKVLTTGETSNDKMPGWAIAVVIIIVILLIVSMLIGGYLLVRRIRDRRRNHGEYRPQLEETLHAKNLPYISPPNIEGLI